MPKPSSDLIGKRFGRLTVIDRTPPDYMKIRKWICKCDCGREAKVTTGLLNSGNTKSCGCLRKELLNTIKRFSQSESK